MSSLSSWNTSDTLSLNPTYILQKAGLRDTNWEIKRPWPWNYRRKSEYAESQKLSRKYLVACDTEVSIPAVPRRRGFALFRAPFDYRPLWIRDSMVSRGFMGNHVAAARSATVAASSGALPTTRWFRVFSNKTENVFPRNEADVVPCTFRGARMSVRIKDKYSWRPVVPGVAFAQWEAI